MAYMSYKLAGQHMHTTRLNMLDQQVDTDIHIKLCNKITGPIFETENNICNWVYDVVVEGNDCGQ